MQDLEEQLDELRKAPVATSREAERAAEAAHLLGELVTLRERANRLLHAAESEEDEEPGDLKGFPMHQAVERILRDAGSPMHIRAIGPELYRRGWRHPKPPYRDRANIRFHLSAMLSQYRAKFQRVGPNTFGLVAWRDRREAPPPPRALFSGPGGPIAQWIGEHPEAPFEGTLPPWLS